jgi:hypothetical protein
MTVTLLLHLANEDPLVVDVEEMPKAVDNLLICHHPRRKDNKELRNIEANVNTLIYPLQRINFIEVLPSGDEEEVLLPYRNS